MKKHVIAVAMVLSGVGLTLAGCGSSTTEVHCCVNEAYYQCPSTDAATQCESQCTRDASKDEQCKS